MFGKILWLSRVPKVFLQFGFFRPEMRPTYYLLNAVVEFQALVIAQSVEDA